MMTLRMFTSPPKSIPTTTTWYLSDLAEARGKQELFTRQSPQRLKALREHAMIESAISSNRIEGVEIDAKRVRTVVFGKPALRDRGEEEVAGYRDALKLIHESAARLAVSEETILRLHRLSRGQVWDAGQYKAKDVDIIETYADGRSRIRFKTVPAKRTPAAMAELVSLWESASVERPVPPLIALAAFNLDFLCIHPFRDGNGRASRLLLLLTCYHLGFEVGRYISLERLIEENKDRYYETLEQSSRGWHDGKNDPWPYINYLLYILKTAYSEFEQRVGQTAEPKGAKSELVLSAIRAQIGEFRIVDIERACPGVGREWIRTLLADLRHKGEVTCRGRGPAARWQAVPGKGTTLR
jgi:Fic family protein